MPNTEQQSFAELREELEKAEGKDLQEYEMLQAALNSYAQATQKFRRGPIRRKLPYVTAPDRDSLMRLHKAISDASDGVLKKDDAPEPLREIARKLRALALTNYGTLLNYDPAKKPKLLSTIEEETRTLTVYKGDAEVDNPEDAMSFALSKRFPMAFVDEKGKQISGLFTEKREMNLEEAFYRALDELIEKRRVEKPSDVEELTYLKEHFHDLKTYRSGLHMSGNFMDNFTSLMTEISDYSNGKLEIELQKMVGLGPKLTAGFDGTKMDPACWIYLAKKLQPLVSDAVIMGNWSKIPDKSRIDTRHSAMSAVADLLGMPNIVARSKPIKIVNPDGSVREGVFMEAGKGIAIDNLPPEAAKLPKSGILENATGKALKDIANLQILDLLCGNIDRHPANMLYQFDENNRLCGVQGIDNDTAFGDVNETFDNRRFMVGTSNLNVIPKDTAKRLLALKPETLEYALRGYGLSEKELGAAKKRLGNLQEKVRTSMRAKKNESRLRILSDKEFNKGNLKHMLPKYNSVGTLQNLYSHAKMGVDQIPAQLQQQHKQYKDLTKAVGLGVKNRANPGVLGVERRKGAALSETLEKRTWRAFTSKPYMDMQKAMTNYVKVYQNIEDRVNRANDEEVKRQKTYKQELQAVVTKQDLEVLRSASEGLSTAAEKYLRSKLGADCAAELLRQDKLYPAGASGYTKARIDAAREVLKLGEQGKTVSAEENQVAEVNQKRARTAQARRQAAEDPMRIREEPQSKLGTNPSV